MHIPHPLAWVYRTPDSLSMLFLDMAQDWIITASTVQHAWQYVTTVGWRRTMPFALAVIALVVYRWSPAKAPAGTCSLPGDLIPIETSMWKHLYYDGTGRPDYASYIAGGRVVQELTSHTYGVETEGGAKRWFWGWWEGAGPEPIRYPPPQYAIYPDRQVGNCWPMRGRSGSLGIKLARPVGVAAFTIDHVPRSMTLNPESAPRLGELWGLMTRTVEHLHTASSISKLSVLSSSAIFQKLNLGAQAKTLYGNHDFVRLGTFAYNIDHYIPFQTFHVPEETIATLGDTHFDTVLLVILDNWGGDNFTCLYRVRIHPK